uniref:TPR_REGION domain-containing protein n=2 Tax=Bursaphelenchus xylophilus TaxID=6326 RepID=A0A1I7SJE3_BURXY
DWAYSADYRHSRHVTSIFGEPSGIRTVFFDDNYDTFLYHPSDDEAYRFPDLKASSRYKACFWEAFTVDKDSMILTDSTNIYAFVASRNSHGEQTLNIIGVVKIPAGNIPLSLCKGIVTCYTSNGKLNTILLNTHKSDIITEGRNRDQLMESLNHFINLKRWRNAWKLCDQMNDKIAWEKLGEAAIRELNMEMAIRVYRRMGKASMVMSLEELKDIEEENLLSGHLLSLLGEFEKADELFCLSSEPWRALEMRRNILDWDRALQLANEVAKDQLPYVSLEYATQLEFMGQYSDALGYYEDALLPADESNTTVAEHNNTCLAGQARMLTKLGEVQR